MLQKKLSLITIVSVVLASLALMFTAFAAVNVTQTFNSSGTIITASSSLGLYSDSACTIPLTSLNWGSLSPGGSTTQLVYIKNTQGSSSLTLSMTSTNWNPTSANGPLTLAWNREGTVLAPGQSTVATLTMTASPTITSITSFSVQISITGTT